MQDRRDTLVSTTHIRKLVYDKQLLFFTVRQINNAFQSRFPIRKLFDIACRRNVLFQQLFRKTAELQSVRNLTAGIENMLLALAEFAQRFCFAHTPATIQHNELSAPAVIFVL